jgi:hypothetical protein
MAARPRFHRRALGCGISYLAADPRGPGRPPGTHSQPGAASITTGSRVVFRVGCTLMVDGSMTWSALRCLLSRAEPGQATLEIAEPGVRPFEQVLAVMASARRFDHPYWAWDTACRQDYPRSLPSSPMASPGLRRSRLPQSDFPAARRIVQGAVTAAVNYVTSTAERDLNTRCWS